MVGELEEAMASVPLDWATLLDGRDVRQWLAGLMPDRAASLALPDGTAALVLADVARALALLPAGWYVWRGVPGAPAWYARRPRTSPAWVVAGGTLVEVATKAAEWEERSRQ